ncbi:hypothetical protein IJI91_02370 [Candidatus Saccharibacteria bacterium]|nr:hypothetical protein [Candidatus Saccharibacteria bacterium]
MSIIGIICVTGVLLLVLISSFVLFSTLSISVGINKAHAESGNSEASLDIADVLDISAPATSTLNCTPGATAASATLCTTTASVNVSTNNTYGYTLQMNATNGSPTALTNTATSPSTTVPTLTQAYSSANFPTNYWGYTGGLDKSSESGGYNCASNYCPILAYDSGGSYAPNHAIKVTDAPAATSSTTITFGSKVDISKPSGTYSTSVTFTAVGNPKPLPPTMQDATVSSLATAMPNAGDTTTLWDIRNDEEYSIAKIGGKYWMTKNLMLGGSSTIQLTQDDSNVSSSGYTLSASSTSGFSDDTAENVYNSGSTTCSSTSACYAYYTWKAATAGTNPSSGDSQYDICPKGWRLPTQAEFDTLSSRYSTGAKLAASPFLGVYAGRYSSSQLNNGGSIGYYWSSTAYSSTGAYRLYFNSYDAGVSSYFKRYGSAVRCVFKS